MKRTNDTVEGSRLLLADATNRSPEFMSSATKTTTEGLVSAKSAAVAEQQVDALRLRISSLEHDLAKQSVKLTAAVYGLMIVSVMWHANPDADVAAFVEEQLREHSEAHS